MYWIEATALNNLYRVFRTKVYYNKIRQISSLYNSVLFLVARLYLDTEKLGCWEREEEKTELDSTQLTRALFYFVEVIRLSVVRERKRVSLSLSPRRKSVEPRIKELDYLASRNETRSI